MKVAPILRELESRGMASVLVHTGQHYDESMSGVFFEELGIKPPDYSLEVGSGSHAAQTARIMERFEPVVESVHPSWVVVVGDVNSTMACALVARKENRRVAHVEAGLRSGDPMMPEEVNRLVTDQLSQLLLASSPDAVEHLRREGHDAHRIVLAGNVMIDTLERARSSATNSSILERHKLERDAYGLLTLHRPSNVDDPETLAAMLHAVAAVGSHPIVWPVHPRLRSSLRDVPSRIEVIDPVGYVDSIALQAAARMVLTDSGGIQEETTVLGTPCLTLRESTERPLTVTEGTNRVVGTDPRAIVAAIEKELAHRTAARRPALWDGRASERIVDALEAFVDR